LIEAAMRRELGRSAGDGIVLGVDCARYGPDNSVLFPRQGLDARSIPFEVYHGLSIPQLEEKVIMFVNRYPNTIQVHVDGGGLGAGLVDHLRLRLGIPVIDVVGSGKPDQGMLGGGRYANKRAECYGVLKEALQTGLCLPNDRDLFEELTCFEFGFDSRGNILLESKDSLRKRNIESPDRGDALALTFGAMMSTLPALSTWAQPQAISEYDPYSPEAMEGRPYPEAKQRGGFTDLETGYQFRMRSRWESDSGFNAQDFADAAASDMLRQTWEEPE
jgi:hypothetical protein